MSNFTETPMIVEVLDKERSGQGLFKLVNSFSFDLGFLGSDVTVTVPAGYITDFASIPFFARWIFPISGKAAKAAVLHDYMCTHYDRRSTKAFNDALKASKVGAIRRSLMVAFVWLFKFPSFYILREKFIPYE